MTRDDLKLVFVAGPFTAPLPAEVASNVRRARAVARIVAGVPGLFPVVTHNLSDGLEHIGDYEFWLYGAVAILRRCDAVVMVPGWQGSTGSTAAMTEAKRLKIPVFDGDKLREQLLRWVTRGK